jgi:hypothetical protein
MMRFDYSTVFLELLKVRRTIINDTFLSSVKMTTPPNPREAWARLLKVAQTAQRSGGAGGGPGPKGVGAGIGGLLLLGGIAVLGNNALFNVDGGHRAIKYTRIGGVKSEIFNEGSTLSSSFVDEASRKF